MEMIEKHLAFPARLSKREFLKFAAAIGAGLMVPRKGWAQCALTQEDRYGPGPYKIQEPARPPSRTVLAPDTEPGERLFIQGRVLAADCQTPVTGARLEVWGANADGCYYHPDSCGDGNDYPLYGQLYAGPDGNYAFETIYPGRYPNLGTYRPRHLHFAIDHPGGSLITQLYFEGDEYIPGDYAAGHPSAESRIIPLGRQGYALHGTFDIHLDAVTTELLDKGTLDPIRNNNKLLVQDRGEHLLFRLPNYLRDQSFSLVIRDATGRERLRYPVLRGALRVEKRVLGSGVHYALVSVAGGRYLRTFRVP